jgi:DNA-binding GntR family transcriptional regulator
MPASLRKKSDPKTAVVPQAVRADQAADASAPESAASESSATESIYQSLLTAIMEHRLLAGTRLVEERLCEATGASRARIRQVFARLAHEKLVTQVPNRGAFIASPSVAEAHAVFQARRVIEPELAAILARSSSPAKVRKLRLYIEQEADAHRRGDRAAIIRLSGEFHILLAEMAGNPFLENLIREMVSLTCLIITLYDRPGAPACPENEHSRLVDAIAAHDDGLAARLMAEHLQHIEDTLDLSPPETGAPDFFSIFTSAS